MLNYKVLNNSLFKIIMYLSKNDMTCKGPYSISKFPKKNRIYHLRRHFSNHICFLILNLLYNQSLFEANTPRISIDIIDQKGGKLDPAGFA